MGGIEQLTSIYLLPRYVKSSDDIVYKLGDLIKSVIVAADRLKQTQDIYRDAAVTLQQTIAANQQQADRFADELKQIRSLLREGFRLPPEAIAEPTSRRRRTVNQGFVQIGSSHSRHRRREQLLAVVY